MIWEKWAYVENNAVKAENAAVFRRNRMSQEYECRPTKCQFCDWVGSGNAARQLHYKVCLNYIASDFKRRSDKHKAKDNEMDVDGVDSIEQYNVEQERIYEQMLQKLRLDRR